MQRSSGRLQESNFRELLPKRGRAVQYSSSWWPLMPYFKSWVTGNLSFWGEIICWTPSSSQVQSTRLLRIFVRAQPWEAWTHLLFCRELLDAIKNSLVLSEVMIYIEQTLWSEHMASNGLKAVKNIMEIYKTITLKSGYGHFQEVVV